MDRHTFHALLSEFLRFDGDEKGRKWNKTSRFFDESDAQSLVKDIIVNKLEFRR
jgi:DNA helicase-2/ATP-dependent DNA helicase PcrA